MIKKSIVLIIFFLGTLTIAASAQTAADRATITDTFGFGPRLGYYQAQDADEGNFYYGIQARFRPGAVVGFEGAVEYRAGQTYGIGDNTVKTSFVPITASLLLFAPISEAFAPYGVLGIGAYHTRFSTSGIIDDVVFDDSSRFNLGYHVGFGAEFPVATNLALNLDYRYLFLNPDDNEESFEGAGFSGNAVSAGIVFYF